MYHQALLWKPDFSSSVFWDMVQYLGRYSKASYILLLRNKVFKSETTLLLVIGIYIEPFLQVGF